MSERQVVDGRTAFLSRRPPVHRHRARDDFGVPYQVALAAQDLLDLLLGDEPFDLGEAASAMARLAQFTADGHHPERRTWSRAHVLARVVELVETYNPPPELGGEIPPSSERGIAGELATQR